jgi:DNA mismatch repair ATPase MutS
MQKIHNYIQNFKQYIAYTLDTMDYHSFISHKLTKYKDFNSTVEYHKSILTNIYSQLNIITPFSFSFTKLTQIGHIMHSFYQLYDDEIYNNSILYSFGFNGYFNILLETSIHVRTNKLVKTKFKKKHYKPIFKKMFYPKYINNYANKIIKNDCNLCKNMIITGPNASGKTTTLKTALINIILSQQIGYGCFESLMFCPYDNIHCYLNIPDTSGRDSLFQAEARRCKEIIDSINDNNNQTHFCVFDELYSGTNPEEAVVSAFAFMDYLIKNNNVTCILTTHYMKLCKKLDNYNNIKNYSMKTIRSHDNFEYTYLLQQGISKIKGGIKVLKDMNYPQEILNNTTNFETNKQINGRKGS